MTRPNAPSLEYLIDTIGADATETLCDLWGGKSLYITKDVKGQLFEKLGANIASELARAFGGDTLVIPLARVWRAQRMKSRGMSDRDIATVLGVTVKTVKRWDLKPEPLDLEELSLFRGHLTP